MKISIHTIPQMTTEALAESLTKEIALQQSRLPGRQNWRLVEAMQDELLARRKLGKPGPLSVEDYLG